MRDVNVAAEMRGKLKSHCPQCDRSATLFCSPLLRILFSGCQRMRSFACQISAYPRQGLQRVRQRDKRRSLYAYHGFPAYLVRSLLLNNVILDKIDLIFHLPRDPENIHAIWFSIHQLHDAQWTVNGLVVHDAAQIRRITSRCKDCNSKLWLHRFQCLSTIATFSALSSLVFTFTFRNW